MKDPDPCKYGTPHHPAQPGGPLLGRILRFLHRQIMRIAYIAHPIGGDVENNLKKITEIVRKINHEENQVVPFAPYYLDLLTLEDSIPEERVRGIRNGTELLKRKFIDEIRLYGNRISPGMWGEIRKAQELGIEIRPMTKETTKEFILNPLD